MLGISTDTWAIHIEGERVGHGDRSADEYRAGYTDSASLERGVGSRGIPGMRRDDLVGRRCNCEKAMSQHRPGVSFLFISLIGTARGGRAGVFGTLAASTPRFCRARKSKTIDTDAGVEGVTSSKRNSSACKCSALDHGVGV